MTEAIRICRTSIAQHSKSFAMASKLLPRPHRDPAAVVYAWCRRADDAIDFSEGDEQRRALEGLRDELDRLYAGEAMADPVLAAFQEVAFNRGIPSHYPMELLAGMEMDAVGVSYETWDDLLLYCYRVASTVGLMMCHVMGVEDERALPHAAHLGLAMQLTNIARDVREDWERSRLYLPDELLVGYGLGWLRSRLTGPLPPMARERCRDVLRALLSVADRYYESGDAGLPFLSPRCDLSVSAARHVYAAIGTAIAKQDHDVFAPRAFVPKHKKLALCVKAALGTVRRRGLFWDGTFKPASLKPVSYDTELVTI